MRAGISVIGLALLICPRVVRRNSSAGHACLQLDILLIAKSGHDRRRYAETLGPGIGVLLHCCQVVGFHHQRASTGVRVDLSCQHLEAGIFVHGLAAFDVINDRLGVLLISGIRSAPLDQETGHLKALRDFQILAFTAGYQWYQTERPASTADLPALLEMGGTYRGPIRYACSVPWRISPSRPNQFAGDSCRIV